MAEALTTYRIIRSRRKTVALRVTPSGEVVVRAPQRCSRAYIEGFVAANSGWIEKQLAAVKTRAERRASMQPKTGDLWSFCGRPLRVEIIPGTCLKLDDRAGVLYLPDLPVEQLKKPLIAAMKKAGLLYLQLRVRDWAERMGLDYQSVTVSSALCRWGSCSRDGRIRLSWMLLLAPEEAVDYVIVHELAHRVEFNHSAAFWALVARYIPDVRERKGQLAALQERLYAQGWTVK